MKKGGEDDVVRQYVIKSNSEYVVRGVTEWLLKWKTNGRINSRGRAVANHDLWEMIDDKICEVEEDFNFRIQFWQVPREYNQEADELAKDALYW